MSFSDIGLERKPKLPVPCHLSFRYLIDALDTESSTGSHATDDNNRKIAQKARAHPKMLAPIQTDAELKELLPDVSDLLSAIFPVNFGEHTRFAATLPFTPYSFFASQAFARSLLDDQMIFRGRLADASADLHTIIVQNMLKFILIHGFHAQVPMELIYHLVEVPHVETGLVHYERISLDLTFCRLHLPENAPSLSDHELDQAISLLEQPERLIPYLPLEGIEIEGFSILRSFDVSSEESLNNIRESILVKSNRSQTNQLDIIQTNIQNLTSDPSLTVSLYTLFEDRVYCLHGSETYTSDIPGLGELIEENNLKNFSHLSAANGNQNFKVCLQTKSDLSPYEQNLKNQGRKTLLVAPLVSGGKTTGYIEFASNRPSNKFHLKTFEMQSLISLLSIAAARRIDAVNQQIENVIKVHCTSVHPTVESRFREASTQLMSRQVINPAIENRMEEIVFENVYPLYSLCRIENSLNLRSKAAREDLITHLNMLEELIQKASQVHETPIYSFTLDNIRQFKAQLREDPPLSLEVKISEFIKQNIDPLVRMISEQIPQLRHDVVRFESKIDHNLNLFYLSRSEVEASMTHLNKALTRLIDDAQIQAQLSFPHYFEKHVSSGLEYSIYIGKSISPHKNFHMNYVKNLRLWQLVTCCQMAKAAESLRSELPVDLRTGIVLVAQDTPVTIQFNYHERRFEFREPTRSKIKRLREFILQPKPAEEHKLLTSPDALTVLYTENAERDEYLAYFEHMKNLGFLAPKPVEKYEVKNIPDASGVMALRVEISKDYLGIHHTESLETTLTRGIMRPARAS